LSGFLLDTNIALLALAAPEELSTTSRADFGSFILCGSGEFPKTIFAKGMTPFGDPID
jgi:hypothetical protein